MWDLKARRGLAVDREKSRVEFPNGGLEQGYKIEIAFFKANFVSAGGLEPPTLCLKGRCSTPELRAQIKTLEKRPTQYMKIRLDMQLIMEWTDRVIVQYQSRDLYKIFSLNHLELMRKLAVVKLHPSKT